MKDYLKLGAAEAAIIVASIAAVVLTGCASTRSRSIELAGMYASEAGTLALGSVDIIAAPQGEETATIKYAEDTAWLSPSTKTHEIKIMLTGTNSVEKSEKIVESICNAFVAVAPTNRVEAATN